MIKKLFFSEENRLKKTDFVVVIILSLILSILTFYSVAGYFYYIENSISFIKIISFVFLVPALLALQVSSGIRPNVNNSDGVELGNAIMTVVISPVVAFVLWYCLFYLLAKVGITIYSHRRFILKHLFSLVIFLIIVSPYALYKLGTNEVDICLSGALKTNDPVEIELCFNNVLDEVLYNGNRSSQRVIDFCMQLSSEKKVWGTDLSYTDYCVYQLGSSIWIPKTFDPSHEGFEEDFYIKYLSSLLPLKELKNYTTNQLKALFISKLCEVYGDESNSLENRYNCLEYFIELSPYPDTSMTRIYCENFPSTYSSPRRCLNL